MAGSGAWQAHRFLSRDEDTILIPGTIFVLVSATFIFSLLSFCNLV